MSISTNHLMIVQNYSRKGTLVKACSVLLVAFFLLAYVGLAEAAANKKFDHFSTGFPLTGAHETIGCESCHARGMFKETPRNCVACHSQGGAVSASAKPIQHILSTNSCADCHSSSAWATAVRVDHSAVIGTCRSCHNGTKAEGKSTKHISSSNICEDCHSNNRWSPVVRVDHGAVNGTCVSCHNGSTAMGKNATHIASSNVCDDCHTTNTWLGAVFDHNGVTGSCASCHNGSIATGKHATHIQTAAQCDDCHRTIAWVPANFNHDAVTGSCSSCHNGSSATGKPATHFTTSLQCDQCHRSSTWTSINFTHSSGEYPGDHRVNLQCQDCHTANSQTVGWTASAYRPDCAACHVGDYRADKHEKSGDGFYSVSELRDCSGACHKPSGHHRVTDPDWDD